MDSILEFVPQLFYLLTNGPIVGRRMNVQTRETDVAVIGGGAAGLFAAIYAAKGGASVMLLEKGITGRYGATSCALWSIQAPFGPRGMDARDSPEVMFRDIVTNGRFLGDQNIIEVITKTACDRILDLESYGLKFRKLEDGRFYQTPFPGQTYPRSVFVYENGHAMSMALAREVQRTLDVWVVNDFSAFAILTNRGRTVGVLGLDMGEGQPVAVKAKATVLATGGYTAMWDFTDNPPNLTGDSLAMAYRAGADLIDLQFCDFYGTDVVWPPSVRGTVVLYELLAKQFTDGNLYNSEGKAIFPKPLPVRDEALRMIYDEIRKGRGTPHGGVWYDVTRSRKSKAEIRKIYEDMTPRHYNFIKEAAGIDLVEEPLEVAPATHYQSGGVSINERCETTLRGLYAAGECSSNFQGGNRVAGMGLCAAITLGAQAGKHAAKYATKKSARLDRSQVEYWVKKANSFLRPKKREAGGHQLKDKVRKTMGTYMAPIRSRRGLERGSAEIQKIRAKLLPRVHVPDVGTYNVEWAEAIEGMLMLETAELAIGCASRRTESRGHHFREDYPQRDDKNWLKHIVVRLKARRPSYSTRPVIYTKIKPPGMK